MSSAWRGAAIIAALVIGHGSPGLAQETPVDTKESMFALRGFGTLALTNSSEKNADFITSTYQKNGAGYTRNPDYGIDSRIGLQLDAKFTSWLSGVIQVDSERQFNGTYRPNIEWANLRFQFTPDFSIRIGRVALPVFMESDSRKVGYTNTWLRPPVDAYSLCPLTSNDGVDASYRFHMGEASLTLQGAVGGNSASRPGGTWFKARNGKLINALFEYKDLTIRANYVTQQMSITGAPVDVLFNGYRAFAAGVAPVEPALGDTVLSTTALDLAQTYEAKDKKTSSYGVGIIWNPGDWIVQGEWVRRTSRCFLADQTAWYVNAGYRIHEVTPYAGLSAVKCDSQTSNAGLPTAGLAAKLTPIFTAMLVQQGMPAAQAAATATAMAAGVVGNALTLNGGLNQLLGLKASEEQHSWTVGIRWDVAKNIDLKLQYDHILPQRDSNSTFTNVQPGFQRNRAINIVAAALDFVF